MPRRSSFDDIRPAANSNATMRPPPGTPPANRELFDTLVASVPDSHFKPSDAPLLATYCDAVLLARRAARDLQIHGPSKWLAVFDKASRTVGSLAARLR